MNRRRLVVATAVLLTAAAYGALAATQNYVAKYDASGALVDSAIYESGGNVGIGTSTPVRQLTINHSTAAVLGLYTNGTERALVKGLAEGSLAFDTGNNERARLTGSGNLGIGVTTPASRLHLAGGGLVFDRYVGDVDPTNGQGSIWVKQDAMTNYEAMVFRATAYQLQHDTGTPYLTVVDGGNIGIATTVPTAKLHVAGDIKADGNLAAKYQDVAEWVPAEQTLTRGTVVSLSEATEGVRRSESAYDHAVAGVVSPQPGIVLGEGGRGKALVAHSGRVRVNVDATYAPIRRGDLLVTSPTPGHAMKSQPLDVAGEVMHRPGTVLGNAIEPLDHGRGEILVLLTLQ